MHLVDGAQSGTDIDNVTALVASSVLLFFFPSLFLCFLCFGVALASHFRVLCVASRCGELWWWRELGGGVGWGSASAWCRSASATGVARTPAVFSYPWVDRCVHARTVVFLPGVGGQ